MNDCVRVLPRVGRRGQLLAPIGSRFILAIYQEDTGMPFIEACLTILGVASGVSGLHAWLTGLKTGSQMEQMLNETRRLRDENQRMRGEIIKL